MTTYRPPRGTSPPASRRYPDPRFSTGTVFASSFDTRYSQQPRGSIDTLTSPRSAGGDRLYDAQPIVKRTYPDSGPSGTKSRTEYAVRPRHNSVLLDERRAPPSLQVPPIHSRPLVNNSARDRPRSPLPRTNHPPDEAERYIYPAVTSPRQSQQRHLNLTSAAPDRLAVSDRDRRERGGYRSSGGPNQRSYPTSGPLVRYQEEDDYSYTGPREQFDRDYPARPRPRRDSYSRRDPPDRPMSVTDVPDWRPTVQSRQEPRPPPSATRQFDKIEKSDSRRSGGRSGTGDSVKVDSDIPMRRHSVRGPALLHQDQDDGYTSQRDELGRRRDSSYRKDRYDEDQNYASDYDDHYRSSHHERRKSRKDSPDHVGTGKGLAAAGLGSLAVGGLASGIAKDSREKDHDSDREARRARRDRRRRERELDLELEDQITPKDQNRLLERARHRPSEILDLSDLRDPQDGRSRKDRSDSDSTEEDTTGGRHRPRRRTRRKNEQAPRSGDSESDSELRMVPDVSRDDHRRDGRERDYEDEDSDFKRDERPRRQDREQILPEENYGESPVEVEDTRPRKVQLVEPTRERELEAKPRGILKPARQVPFPEDPNPTREGVAPLKEAGKKGVPPGARWTKINRMLVNPDALKASHERFEERDDYVIVLRVLSKEDIQKLADKTRDIRLARELEWQEGKKRKDKGRHQGTGYSSDEDTRNPLAIEAPPPPSQADPRFMPPQRDGRAPAPDMAAAMAGLNIRSE